jgi:hypothetical protein
MLEMENLSDQKITDVKRKNVLTSRTYPKCFNTNLQSSEIYDLFKEEYQEIHSSVELKYNYGLYTLLLCAIKKIQDDNQNLDLMRIRLARSLKLDAHTSWEFLIQILKLVYHKNNSFIRSKLKNDDYQYFMQRHELIFKRVFNVLETNISKINHSF